MSSDIDCQTHTHTLTFRFSLGGYILGQLEVLKKFVLAVGFLWRED